MPDQDLVWKAVFIGQDARREIDPDAQHGIDGDPGRGKPGHTRAAEDVSNSV